MEQEKSFPHIRQAINDPITPKGVKSAYIEILEALSAQDAEREALLDQIYSEETCPKCKKRFSIGECLFCIIIKLEAEVSKLKGELEEKSAFKTLKRIAELEKENERLNSHAAINEPLLDNFKRRCLRLELEIASLTSKLELAKKALKPFAKMGSILKNYPEHDLLWCTDMCSLHAGDCVRADKALLEIERLG